MLFCACFILLPPFDILKILSFSCFFCQFHSGQKTVENPRLFAPFFVYFYFPSLFLPQTEKNHICPIFLLAFSLIYCIID